MKKNLISIFIIISVSIGVAAFAVWYARGLSSGNKNLDSAKPARGVIDVSLKIDSPTAEIIVEEIAVNLPADDIPIEKTEIEVEKIEEIVFVEKKPSECFLKLTNKILTPYSKDNFLPASYVPSELKQIYSGHNSKQTDNHFLTFPSKLNLEMMLIEATSLGLDIKVVSAYRSYAMQKAIKKYKIEKYGIERANEYSADPGFSEHQLGTTVDISTGSVKYALTENFENTPEFL